MEPGTDFRINIYYSTLGVKLYIITFAELRSKASGETGRPRIAYIYHLVSFIL